MTRTRTLGFEEVHRFLAGLFEGDLHAKRVLSLANATLGVKRPPWQFIRSAKALPWRAGY